MAGDVMVLVPAPILTITVEQRGSDDDVHVHAGGQGVWQARMISSLGVRVVVCTALGGETGRTLEALLAAEGLAVRVVRTEAATKAYIHDRRGGERVEVAQSPGSPLTRHERDELYGLALAEGLRSSMSLLGGTPDRAVIEPAVYRRLASDLRRNGCQTAADLSGDYLTEALAGGLSLVKVSHEELIASGRVPADGENDLIHALGRLHDEGADAVVISRAEQPALAYLGGAAYRVVAPQLQPADPRGAGDSMTAGAVAVLATGGDPATAVRTGAAAGAVNVTRHGLGTGEPEVVSRILERVTLVPVTGAAPGAPPAADPASRLAGERQTSLKQLAEDARSGR
jgi:1-phosphofructokinase